MEIIDNIVSPDERRRKYSDRQILKVLVLLQLFRVSYRSAKIFLTNHGEYIKMIGIKDIPPSFQTLSGMARLFDLHSINREVTSIYSMESITAIDSVMVHTCGHYTAIRRRK
ncbi:MAG: hypothetical protein M1317_00655 [Candidatus Thermoplasmatota archaeon]|nr:hypothetical protein [Candidatus Thermoplasmatota archaeon]